MGEPSSAGARGSSRTLGALLLAAIFLLGMVSGAALFYAGQRSIARDDPRTRVGRGLLGREGREPVERFARDADLLPEQREQVRTIMRETREEMRTVVERSRERLGEVLTPEQQEKLDAWRPRGRWRQGDRPRRGRRQE